MPDGRWADRIKAAGNARGHLRDAVNLGARTAKSAGTAAGNAADGLAALVTSIEGPTVPLLGTWSVGLGRLLAGHPDVPDPLRRVVRGLDRLGELTLSRDVLSFDGDAVRWERIDEITFGSPTDVLASHALEHEMARLTALLPPVPGRARLIRYAAGVLAALCLAVAGPAGSEETDGGDGVPVSIAYRGRVRRKELKPGVFVALVAASTPAISQAIAQIAGERGVKLTVAPPSRARRQAVAMRRLAASVAGRFGHDDPLAVESAAHPPAVHPDQLSSAGGERRAGHGSPGGSQDEVVEDLP